MLYTLSFSLFDVYPVAWGCRIHRLQLCRGVRPLPHECSGHDTKQSDVEAPVMLELWWMQYTPSLPSLSGLLWPGVVAPDRVLSMGQIELNYVLMLNLIARNRTVLTFKICTYVKLNCFKWNCFCTPNWIVWKGTVFDLKVYLRWTELFEMELFWHLTECKQKLHLYETELFELDLFDWTE